ncbi:hypothetical protein [Sphingomonas sp. 22R3R2A-7]|uniref:hypothetical protein n=1 Tax=Sphingomonas sp. 22R3R2A-7 TaxID=3050230 RepID=UPI002FE14703
MAGKRVAETVDLAPIRADLEARIAAIDVRAPYSRACDLAPDVDAIRLIAHRAGMNPAVTVAHFIDLGAGAGRTRPARPWLAGDAEGRDRQRATGCPGVPCICRALLRTPVGILT